MNLRFAMVLAALAAPAIAEETRELDSHEHGVGELNIAIEGSIVAMELHAPGADIVGFEYHAESVEDRAAIDRAVAALARPLDLFVLPAATECSVVQASAALATEEAHDEHEYRHDDDHADEYHHDEEDIADEEGHAEFHAEYTLTCGNPEALSEITFAYFDTFKNARELEVQIVSANGAQAFEVEPDAPTLNLRGMFKACPQTRSSPSRTSGFAGQGGRPFR